MASQAQIKASPHRPPQSRSQLPQFSPTREVDWSTETLVLATPVSPPLLSLNGDDDGYCGGVDDNNNHNLIRGSLDSEMSAEISDVSLSRELFHSPHKSHFQRSSGEKEVEDSDDDGNVSVASSRSGLSSLLIVEEERRRTRRLAAEERARIAREYLEKLEKERSEKDVALLGRSFQQFNGDETSRISPSKFEALRIQSQVVSTARAVRERIAAKRASPKTQDATENGNSNSPMDVLGSLRRKNKGGNGTHMESPSPVGLASPSSFVLSSPVSPEAELSPSLDVFNN